MERQIELILHPATVRLLRQLAQLYFDGDESRTIKAALESLASHTGCEGWSVAGYALPGVRPDEGRMSPDGDSWETAARPIVARRSDSVRER